jgi:hypothetical protein
VRAGIAAHDALLRGADVVVSAQGVDLGLTERRVLAYSAYALVRRAFVVVAALRGKGASFAARDGRVYACMVARVARIVRAGVVVVALRVDVAAARDRRGHAFIVYARGMV